MEGLNPEILQEICSTKMPFGKYKGRKMVDLPIDYLKWLAETVDETTVVGRRICLTADRLYQKLKED